MSKRSLVGYRCWRILTVFVVSYLLLLLVYFYLYEYPDNKIKELDKSGIDLFKDIANDALEETKSNDRFLNPPKERGRLGKSKVSGVSWLDVVTCGVDIPDGPEDNVRYMDFVFPQSVDKTESNEHRKTAFRDIFLEAGWGNNTDTYGNTRSGPGSLYQKTEAVRRTLENIIGHVKKKFKKSTVRMLDIPCGDMSWMRHFLSKRNDVIYTGMDLVPEVIKLLTEEFKFGPNSSLVDLQVGDAVTDSLGSYDIILSRHMTQHISDHDTLKVLENVSKSQSKYLLMTTYPGSFNTDLRYGLKYRFRPQNLELPPYSLVPPICQNKDGERDFTALWRLPLKQVKNCVLPPVDRYMLDQFGQRHYTCL